MKITDVRTMRLWGPRTHDVGGGSSMIGKLIVRIDTDAGLYGLGEADDFLGVREALSYIGEILKGRDPMQVRPLVSEVLYGTLPPHHPLAKHGVVMPNGRRAVASMSPTATATGPIVWAMSGVEIALCDLVGKALNAPVYNLLGGSYRDRVKIYLDRSAPSDKEDLDAWRAMAGEAVASGFTQLKFDAEFVAPERVEDVWSRSLPLAQINRTVERLEAVRDEVGWDVEICVDCHMHYNVPDAIRLADSLAHLKLKWIEDPTPILNPDSAAEVRSRSAVPICVGEMFIAEQCRLFIDGDACDVIHPDVIFCGGLHEARRIGEYAELHHLPVALHGNGGALATVAAAHVASATRSFLGLEYHFIETDWIGGMIRRDAPLFEDGYLRLTDRPGLGVELDEFVCERVLAPGEALF